MNKFRLQKIVAPGTFSILSVCLLLGLLFGSYFLNRRIEPDLMYSSYFFVQWREWQHVYPFIAFVSSFTLVTLLAVLLFRANEKYSFIRIRTILPSFLFVFLITVSNYKIEACSGLPGSIFLLVFIWIFLSTYQEREPMGKIFNAFFVLSVGSFFCFDLLLLVPACWLSFSFFRIGSVRTLLASFIGLIIPYIICLPILFLTGDLQGFIALIEKQLTYSIFTSQLPEKIFLFALFILTFVNFVININADKIRTRQTLYFFCLLTFNLFTISVLKDSFIDIFPMTAMVLSILIGHYFSLKNSLLSFICFMAMILVAVVFYLL